MRASRHGYSCKDGRTALPDLSGGALGNRLRLSRSRHDPWRNRASLPKAPVFLSALQEDRIRIRSSTEISTGVFSPATPVVPNEHDRFRLLAEGTATELPRPSDVGRCPQDVVSVWRYGLATESSCVAFAPPKKAMRVPHCPLHYTHSRVMSVIAMFRQQQHGRLTVTEYAKSQLSPDHIRSCPQTHQIVFQS
jgi:hypothetical protein